jgi:hypothetical protein
MLTNQPNNITLKRRARKGIPTSMRASAWKSFVKISQVEIPNEFSDDI